MIIPETIAALQARREELRALLADKAPLEEELATIDRMLDAAAGKAPTPLVAPLPQHMPIQPLPAFPTWPIVPWQPHPLGGWQIVCAPNLPIDRAPDPFVGTLVLTNDPHCTVGSAVGFAGISYGPVDHRVLS